MISCGLFFWPNTTLPRLGSRVRVSFPAPDFNKLRLSRIEIGLWSPDQGPFLLCVIEGCRAEKFMCRDRSRFNAGPMTGDDHEPAVLFFARGAFHSRIRDAFPEPECPEFDGVTRDLPDFKTLSALQRLARDVHRRAGRTLAESADWNIGPWTSLAPKTSASDASARPASASARSC